METRRRRDRDGSCTCGAPADQVVRVVQRTRDVRVVHMRCTECLREWSRAEPAPDLNLEVESGEVIAAHEALNNPNVKLEDLL